jgi:hypothetical protein
MTETIAVLTIISLAFAADLLATFFLSVPETLKRNEEFLDGLQEWSNQRRLERIKRNAEFWKGQAWMTINEARLAEGLPPLKGQMPLA